MASSLKWKTWLLSNFEHCEGGLIGVKAILSAAQSIKENVNCPPSSALFGQLIKQLWGEKVKLMKRGSRNQRENYYRDLRWKSQVTSNTSLKQISGWHVVGDQRGDLAVIRHEPWSFKNQRVVTEVTFNENGSDSIFLRSHGCQTEMKPFLELRCMEKLTLAERVDIILSIVDSSTLCRGVPIKDGKNLHTTLPHESGVYADLRIPPAETVERRGFSANCSVLSNAGQCCCNCFKLRHLDQRGRKRKLATNGEISPFTNKRYLSKEEVTQQLRLERQARINAEKRERYWREKFQNECFVMANEDHADLCKMFEGVGKDIPEHMASLWEQQHKLLEYKSKNAYRWHPKVMRLCLDIYCKNPHVLDPLRQFIILPSNRTIRMYKNKVKETTGWNDEVLIWCMNAAKENGLKPADYLGGFAIDEMKIQENLEMTSVGGKHKLVGFVDLGKSHDLMRNLSGQGSEPELATHVLQFVFLSDGGFRFPIAQWPSANCTPSDLYHQFWEGVLKMSEIGFGIYWCVLNGADCNRQFIKLHFKHKDPVEAKFVTTNIYTGGPMIVIMDPKHNIKKLRNNIHKSNISGKPRCLKIGGKSIMWKQFRSAFDWDQQSFSLPLHEKLSSQHMDLDSASIMRNKLAEDVLDAKMLFLMQEYQEHLKKTNNDGDALDAVIELLQHTSELVRLFNDRLYITSTDDSRLRKLNKFYNWMCHWEREIEGNNHNFISSKLWFDLKSMCLGFQSLVHYKISKFPSTVIKPAIVNQDCVENHFCQIRSCNGQNDNPTFLQQQSTQNSIRLGQTTISSKSNASCNSTRMDKGPSIEGIQGKKSLK